MFNALYIYILISKFNQYYQDFRRSFYLSTNVLPVVAQLFILVQVTKAQSLSQNTMKLCFHFSVLTVSCQSQRRGVLLESLWSPLFPPSKNTGLASMPAIFIPCFYILIIILGLQQINKRPIELAVLMPVLYQIETASKLKQYCQRLDLIFLSVT